MKIGQYNLKKIFRGMIPLTPSPSQTYFMVSKHIHCVCSSSSRRRDAFTFPDVHKLLTLLYNMHKMRMNKVPSLDHS